MTRVNVGSVRDSGIASSHIGGPERDGLLGAFGVPELTEDDRALIGQCLAALEARVREDPADGRKFLKFVLGSGPL